MVTGENKIWGEVVATLNAALAADMFSYEENRRNLIRARDLCERMAKGARLVEPGSNEPLVERPTPAQDEREHCLQVADIAWRRIRSFEEMLGMLISERAALRAECEAKYSALLTSWAELKERHADETLRRCDAENMNRETTAELERLRARVQELERVCTKAVDEHNRFDYVGQATRREIVRLMK